MKAASTLLLLVAVAGCGTSSSILDRQSARLGPLVFDVPSTWHRTDSARRGVITAEWRPEDNDAQESLVVMRTEQSPVFGTAGPQVLGRLLAQAQGTLPNVRSSDVKQFVTPSGLDAAEVSVTFQKAAGAQQLQRTHVVVAEGDGALIHVLYTSKRADQSHRALHMVLDSVHREEKSK